VSPCERPNLIFVLADQLRYMSCGYAGDERARTPNLDRLVGEGASLSNAVSGSPICAPYRASLFTGKYSSSTGMVINELRMSPNHTCFGHVLHEGAYDTYYIGKWHLWANELGNHHDPRNSYTPPGPHRLGFDGFWAAYNFHHTYFETYYHTDSPERKVIGGYEPDGQTDLAIAKLREAAGVGRPFAVFLSVGTPHDPWGTDNVPPADLEAFQDTEFPLPPNYLGADDPHADSWAKISPSDRAALGEWMRVYYAMTANLDANLGRLLAAVDELGMRDSTAVVFTSDHGEMFGAQGRRAKNVFYDEAVRVPLAMRWPGRIPEGHVCDACMNTPDLMPTLLSLMGLPTPEGVEGSDLSASVLGGTVEEPDAAFMQGMGCTAKWQDGHEWRALRSKRHTYAVYRSDGCELLFDNRDDPYQTHNLAGDATHANLLRDFRVALKGRMAALGDTFEACTWYRDHWTDDRVILRSATLQG